MAKGMFFIRRFARHSEPDQGYQVAAHIRQVVYSVRLDGNGPGQRADEQLCPAQKDITAYPNNARQTAIGFAHKVVLGILRVLDKKPDQ